MPWSKAIEAPGAAQMRHAKDLLLSYPFFTRIPDPDLVVPGPVPELVPGGSTRRFVATRDAEGSFALVYAPVGCAFAVDLTRLAGPRVRARWMDPRTGSFTPWVDVSHDVRARFVSPTPGELLDWVLVLESVR